LKVCDTKTNIEARLLALNIKPNGGEGEQLLVVHYRLDEGGTLRCSYKYQGQYRGKEILYDRNIYLSPIYISVKAPTNFTGVWIEYYVNGRKCLETNMKDGRACGDLKCFSPEGRRVYIERHDPSSPEVQTTYYNNDRSIIRTENRPKP
jgi:hypothetical protein